MKSAYEVLECLRAGQCEALIGQFENGWLDAKESPYVFSSDKQRMELAKDVSALANAAGGILILGFATMKNADISGDRIDEVKPFPLSMVNSEQIRKLLAEWVYPSLEKIDVLLFPDKNDPAKGVVAIVVTGPVQLKASPISSRRCSTRTKAYWEHSVGTSSGYKIGFQLHPRLVFNNS